ncbi:DNA/RNA helicase domain-containing protein [Amycolatopsis keratiniphila]|uniref:DNA/RNA helicase domain-containing protein n=1 Tax=Amycolatopsis keratiniphila TaxID=129921 RepID=UPI0033DF2C05
MHYYQTLQPQRLVITGAPGAGKTVLALELLLGLLETRGPEHPVPVRIPATLWDSSHPLREWLVQHLVTTYRQAPRTAQALVNAGLILPVIDGLDEETPRTPPTTPPAPQA